MAQDSTDNPQVYCQTPGCTGIGSVTDAGGVFRCRSCLLAYRDGMASVALLEPMAVDSCLDALAALLGALPEHDTPRCVDVVITEIMPKMPGVVVRSPGPCEWCGKTAQLRKMRWHPGVLNTGAQPAGDYMVCTACGPKEEMNRADKARIAKEKRDE